MKKELIFAFVITFLLTFVSCQENPSDIGNNILSQTDSISTITFDSWNDNTLPVAEMLKRRTVMSPSALNLLLNGKNNGYESFSIVWFTDYRDTILYDTIVKADIIFHTAAVAFGDNNVQSLELHKVQKSTSTSLIDLSTTLSYLTASTTARDILTKNDIVLDEDAKTVYTGRIKPNTEVIMPIDTTIVKGLLYGVNEGESVVNGLLFLTNIGSNTISSFVSTSSTDTAYWPHMRVVRLKNGALDTVTLNSVTDESIMFNIKTEGYHSSNTLYTGLGDRMRFKFEINKIPKDVIIKNAFFTLTLDSINSDLNYIYGADSLKVVSISDSSTLTNDATISVLSKYTTADGLKKFVFDLAPLVQKWMLGKTNYGFEVYPYSEYYSPKVRCFYGPKNSDKNKTPRLEVKYFLPPK
jgi:hypothetical protein